MIGSGRDTSSFFNRIRSDADSPPSNAFSSLALDYGNLPSKGPFPYTSTPVKDPTAGPRSKLECDFRDNGSFQPSAFSSNGLDVSNFEFSGFGQNERTLSSSSNNSSSTSFISDGSFNTILRNAQDDSINGSDGFLSNSSPYRDDVNAVEADDSDSYRRHLENLESYKKIWNYSPFSNCQGQLNGTHDDSRSRSLNGSNGRVDWVSSLPNKMTQNSDWISSLPRDMCQQEFVDIVLPRLPRKKVLTCLQLLDDIIEECSKNGDTRQVNQAVVLSRTIEQHLLNKTNYPTSPFEPSPREIRSPSHDCNDDRPRPPPPNAAGNRAIPSNPNVICTWSGQLPPRIHKNATYSVKVFLGGVPWDITEDTLVNAFKQFGNVIIEWPAKKDPSPTQKKGYAYAIFEHEKQVKMLLQSCTQDYTGTSGKWYFQVSTNKARGKNVEVIPWAISESNYTKCQGAKITGDKTIFVGALHGMLNSEALALIMDNLFGGVAYAGIDTNCNKYPIGSGRVTFTNSKSYWKAINAAFVDIKTPKFNKTLQIDPYVVESTCSVCELQQGPYFCRELSCFRYFCRTCRTLHHSGETFSSHRVLERNGNKLGAVTTQTLSFPQNSSRQFDTSSMNGNWNQKRDRDREFRGERNVSSVSFSRGSNSRKWYM